MKIRRSVLIPLLTLLVVALLSVLGNHSGTSASLATPTPGGPPIEPSLSSLQPSRPSESVPVVLSMDKGAGLPESQPGQVPLSPAENVSLVLDDGTAEDALGPRYGDSEFLFLNRFTPNPSLFPFNLIQIQVLFESRSGVTPGDHIRLVVYQDDDSDPSNGATLLAAFPATIQKLNEWNAYAPILPGPLVVRGPVDVLVGVIALEKPGTAYYPASIDTTTWLKRSWIGFWSVSPPPENPTLPTDDGFDLIDRIPNLPTGNWMIRAYGTTIPLDKKQYLPSVMKP